MRTVVSKTEFAALVKRDISTVSHWIADGKISQAALVGEGRKKKIWYERARADLALKLDPGQQGAQENPVALSSIPMPQPEPSVAVTADVPAPATSGRSQPTDAEDDDLRRKRKADADRAVQEAIASLRRNEIESGRWVDAQEVRKEYGHELSKLIGSHDTFVGSTLARALADRFVLDWKDVSLICRAEYRKFRSDGAEQTAAELAAHEAEIAAAHAAEPIVADTDGPAVAGAADLCDGAGTAAAG